MAASSGMSESATNSPAARSRFRIFWLAWVIAFTGAVTPGSMLALVIGQVLAQGFQAVLLILAGHAILEAFFILGFALGAMRFLQRRRVRGLLAVVGGLALAWMGADILLHLDGVSLEQNQGHVLSWWSLILGGMAVSISNPYFTGWWATIGSGQIATLGMRGPADFAIFWIGHELGDIVWYVFVAMMLVLGAHWLDDAAYRGLLAVCGGLICLLGVGFVILGARYLATARGAAAARPD
jgi:threonine/homoserine/homoserine lactone efflux protein